MPLDRQCVCGQGTPYCPEHQHPPKEYEVWWCSYCGEPELEDPCQRCGNPVSRYDYVRAE